jgi:hypothetical protein
MTTLDTNQTQPTPVAQTAFFDEVDFDEAALLAGEEWPDELDLAAWLGYEEPPILLVDTDPERAVTRQKEMMDCCFGGIGEERKPEKRMGLAMQQLDIENRHALLLLLTYEEPAALVAHLRRCLADPAYGYGERGSNGRTIAQAMAALAEGGDLAEVATGWLAAHRDFQERALGGQPFSFRSLFDLADLDSFAPVVQRLTTGEQTGWQLGLEGEGKTKVFPGAFDQVWPDLCDTYVEWAEADNQIWLDDLKRRAARLPTSILRTARAERLRKENDRLEIKGNQVILTTERPSSSPSTGSGSISGQEAGQDWPRSLILGDQIGLSRLSGHSFYELAWEGGRHVRRFELSSTSRHKLPVEHIELALELAETLALEQGVPLPPVSPAEVEAAFLRWLKVKRAEIGPPAVSELPPAIKGRPAASYNVGNITATLLIGGKDFAYITRANETEQAVLLRRDDKRGLMLALPVRRGRPQLGQPLVTTPLAELDLADPAFNRCLCAWGAWVVGVSCLRTQQS